MSIFENLKAELNKSRKARTSARTRVLSTVVGELAANAKVVDGQKVVTDEEAVALIKEHIRGIEDLVRLTKDVHHYAEKEILEEFLPHQLTKDELILIKRAGMSKGRITDLKSFMAELKQNWTGQYNGKLAVEVWNESV